MPGQKGRCPFVGPRPGEESPGATLFAACVVEDRFIGKVCFAYHSRKTVPEVSFPLFYKGNWRKPACLSKSIRPMLRDAAFHLIAFPCNVKPTVVS